MSESGTWQAVLSEIDHCNKCGFCLPACPTFQITGKEEASPRGRIAIIEGLAQGEIAADETVEDALSHCLGCRACETACPSGVHYNRIYEGGMAALRAERPSASRLRFTSRQMLRLVRHPKRLGTMLRLGATFKNAPMPAKLRRLAPMLGYREEPLGPPPKAAPEVGKVAFFGGCVMEGVFSDVNEAARGLLEAAGFRVVFPEAQGCCGALHLHAGRQEEARTLARANIEAFEAAGDVDWIVNTAGGCGAMMCEYAHLFAGDPVWEARAEAFGRRVKDWSEVLWLHGSPLDYQGDGSRVTLQNSCHLVNVEKAGAYPVSLVEKVAGDTFLPMASQNSCCGSAGIYNLEHTDWSLAILDRKVDELASLGPERILVNNPGCHLQMRLGAGRLAGGSVGVEHLAHYLYRAHLRARGHAVS